MTDYSEQFAARLRSALGHMTQAELISILAENGFKITQARLSHYMQGRNYPDPPVLMELVRALEVSADWLLGLTEDDTSVAELQESLAQSKGDGKVDRLLRQLSAERQQQVIQFAEFLLAQQQMDLLSAKNGSPLPNESWRIGIEAQRWLDSIERARGAEFRKEIEKILRDRGLFIDRAS